LASGLGNTLSNTFSPMLIIAANGIILISPL